LPDARVLTSTFIFQTAPSKVVSKPAAAAIDKRAVVAKAT